MKNYIIILLSFFTLFSCKETTLPKPEATLRLDYEKSEYESVNFLEKYPYTFKTNRNAIVEPQKKQAITISYPKMKATVYTTYKPVQNNIKSLLNDAQKLTYDHAIKADEITTQPFINEEKRVFGMFSQIGGNAATNAQFYVTDSVTNFLTASLYFNVKPNFDSIYPAIDYIKNDMRYMMETLKWRNKK